jgi:acyl-CoA synthetase (AMP-forming)/AMP-acid ligase II
MTTNPSPDLVLDRLAKNIDKDGSKTLFTFLGPGLDGGRVQKSYTYSAFAQETSNLAQRLLESGLKQGDRALLVYPPSLDFIVAFFACIKSGIIAVPVFPPNPARRDTLHMFEKIAESSGAQVALTNVEYNHFKKLASVKDALTRFKRPLGSWPENLTWMTTDDKKQPKSPNNASALTIEPQDIAFLQYTSGSTSEPKGVMITHGNLAHNLTIITNELEAGTDTIVASWLPQYHDMGLIGSYLGIGYCGGTGYYMSPLSFLQRPMLWIEAVSKYQATHCQAPNFAFKLTARKFQASNYVNKPLKLKSLKHIINAAEPVDEEGMKVFKKEFEPFGLGNVIFPTYGLAEHTVFVCSGGTQIIGVVKEKLEVDGEVVLSDTKDSDAISRLVGCGYPARQGVDVRIVNRETCNELGEGKVGEIWVSSPSKAAGYFRKGPETKAEFQATLEGNGEKRFLRTGDLGFLHNAELFICGRLKDLIIVAGRNYYPQDLEATAEAASDQLRPGCSAAFTIDPTHEGGEEVALVMELREVPSANDVHGVCNPLADQVRSVINQEHSISITQIVFLQTKTVPKTTSGKIARAWCRKAFVGGTLKVVFRKSFKDETATFGIEESSKAAQATPLSQKDIQELRNLSTDEIKDKLRVDVAKIGQIPPDCIDDDTALITVLDSLSLSQFKGSLESGYAVQISDEYLFGETTTLTKLAEVVKLGHAPDDTGMSDPNRPPSTAMAPQGNAGGLAGALGCPPGVVCCVVQ